MAEVQTGATVDLTPILPKPDPPPLARSFSRDAPLPLQDAEKVLLSSHEEILTPRIDLNLSVTSRHAQGTPLTHYPQAIMDSVLADG